MRILHLYHDIMNLYGEYANVAAMERLLTKSSLPFTTDRLSLGDKPVLTDYDFIYIGSGTERNRNVVMEDLRQYRSDLSQYIDSGKVLLLTGNSFEMLGKTITDADGTEHKALGLFDFTVTEQKKTRTTADAVFRSDFCEQELVGFINKCSEIQGISTPLFKVLMGLGNQSKDTAEGLRHRNLFGTHLTGPILIKNPHFLLYIAGLCTGGAPLKEDWMSYEKAAYELTLRELKERMQEHKG